MSGAGWEGEQAKQESLAKAVSNFTFAFVYNGVFFLSCGQVFGVGTRFSQV